MPRRPPKKPFKIRVDCHTHYKNPKWFFEVLDTRGQLLLTSKFYTTQTGTRLAAQRFTERINKHGILDHEDAYQIPRRRK